ncbi:MAG: DUF2505 domain-containing protein [Myxococcota bacterium]
MRTLVLNQSYDVPPSVLMDALLHPQLDAFMAERVPDLQSRTELRRVERGNVVERAVRCVPVPKIPEAARHAVKPDMIQWVEESRADRSTGVITVRVIPDSFRSVFDFQGTMRITPQGSGALRRVEGQLTIKMLLVGKLVEDYLIEEIRRNMEAEGEALREFVRTVARAA